MTQHGQVQFVCDRHAVRLAEKDDFLARGVEKLEARTSPFQFHGLAVLLNQRQRTLFFCGVLRDKGEVCN